METANSPIFLKLGNGKDHQKMLNFAILAEKRQKNTPFQIKLPVKNFHGRAKGGRASHRGPPLNMPLLTETTLQQLTGTLLFKDYLAVLKNTASSIN